MVTLTYPIVGYLGRVVLGLGMAVVLASMGVVLARGGLLLFGLTSWLSWLTLLIAGAGVGAGLGSGAAWLSLRGLGHRFTLALTATALIAGWLGGWFAYYYGADLVLDCCRILRMGAVGHTILGATVAANLAATLIGGAGRGWVWARRQRGKGVGGLQSVTRQE